MVRNIAIFFIVHICIVQKVLSSAHQDSSESSNLKWPPKILPLLELRDADFSPTKSSSPVGPVTASIEPSSSIGPLEPSESVLPSIEPSSSIGPLEPSESVLPSIEPSSSIGPLEPSESVLPSIEPSPSIGPLEPSESVLPSIKPASSIGPLEPSESVLPSIEPSPSIGPLEPSESALPSIEPSPSIGPLEPSESVPPSSQVVHNNNIHIYDDKKACLVATFAINFEIVYSSTKGEKQTNIPLNSKENYTIVDGDCSFHDDYAYLKIKWNDAGININPKHQFEMHFKRNSENWSVPSIKAIFDTNDSLHFDNPVGKEIKVETNGFGMIGIVDKDVNYICLSLVTYNISTNVKAAFQNVAIQPFSNDPQLSHQGKHCLEDTVPNENFVKNRAGGDRKKNRNSNTVPIAVGAALGGVVLIVLVSYIIGRSRSDPGYERVF